MTITQTNTAPAEPTKGLAVLLVAIIVGATALAGLAGVLSYATMVDWARPELGEFAPLFPVTVDAGMLVFAAMTFYKTLKGYRRTGVRLATHALAGLSVLFNAMSGVVLEYQLMHATAPLVLIISTESLIGIAYKHRLETAPRLDRIRPSRWFLAPVSTLLMWRRMVLWEITSAETARQIDALRVRQLMEWQREHGRLWRWKVRPAERAALRLALTSRATGMPLSLGDVPPLPTPVPAPASRAGVVLSRDVPPAESRDNRSPASPSRPVPAPRPALDTTESSRDDRPVPYAKLPDAEKRERNERIAAALAALNRPDSPWTSQAQIAAEHGVSTSQLSRIKASITKVNGS